MSRKGEQFAGLTVAMATPFSSGEVDEKRLREAVHFHIEAGTDCLAPVGTTGESPTLTHEEHDQVISIVCQEAKAAGGKIRVMAGTGSNSTAEAIRLTQAAKNAGADGALMVAPYYNKPTQDGFYAHFEAVAREVGLPIVLYNIPGRTSKNVEPETIAKLAELPEIVAIKEAAGSMDQASRILGTCNLTLLSGDDSMTIPFLSVGGSGVVSVVGNIVPGDVQEMLAAWNAGDIPKAQEWHHKLFALASELLSIASNPIPVKAALQMLGRDSGEVRLPMVPLNDEQRDRLRSTLTQYGLLS